ncbi:MAG: LLM class flavin-dependent oxidoreductase, partial [Chloroflexota bacterium]
MRFGLFINKQYLPGESARSRYLEHIEQVRLARDLGFDTVIIGQHFLSAPFQEPQSVPLLARFAAESGDMRLGVSILLGALLPPLEVAEMGATLDLITGGRFICGLGLGYRQVEFDAFGVPMDQRVRRFEDNVQLIRRLWTEERVSFESPYCRLEDATLTLKPLQQPHPPIWIAANADNAVRRAARIGDTWAINTHNNRTAIRRQLGIYKEELQRLGRGMPADLPLRRDVYIAPGNAQAWSEGRPFIDTKYDAYRSWGQQDALPQDDAWADDFRELAKDRLVIGDPMAVREDLSRYLGEL